VKEGEPRKKSFMPPGSSSGKMGDMGGLVSLRPIVEADWEPLARFSLEPEALGEYEWTGFTHPQARHHEWEDNGLLGEDSSTLAVITTDGNFIGFVVWRKITIVRTRGAPRRSSGVFCYEIGIALLPEHRGQGYGTAAQKLLVDYLFQTTVVHRIQATTEADNITEQCCLEKVGFQREGVLRSVGFRAGHWVDGVLYSILRDDVRPAENEP
jgi:RimJ/RimL family protein N-acetyltransferase